MTCLNAATLTDMWSDLYMLSKYKSFTLLQLTGFHVEEHSVIVSRIGKDVNMMMKRKSIILKGTVLYYYTLCIT